MSDLHRQDFHAWTRQQADLIRSGRFAELDAVNLIDEIEGMDRGRYAGPVGWFDANGDGEFGIALRSAHVSGNKARLFAGCGIVANSDPEAELAESQAKLVPVRDALSG